jgi:predicted RNA binding protein YcfA (HicA-like mRNA interferase family)
MFYLWLVKRNELKRILLEDGWYVRREGANHTIYRHPTKPNQIPLGRHGNQEVAQGTLRNILKQAGLK